MRRIQQLGPKARAQLTSTFAIAEPASAIKELIENALDSTARKITVTMTADTVTLLQVRDDGTGIPARDRRFVGMRHFTSKIVSVLELESLGGRTMGFRGEALAALVDVAQSVRVASCHAGESAAAEWFLGHGNPSNQDWEVMSQCVPVVHLNGTTVTVTRLFHEIPSRREQVNKLAPFSRAKIRALVRTYALARPHVRFELLVKPSMGEVDMREFLYVPHPTTPFILDAARKILGPDVASGLTVERALSARYAIVVLLPAKNHQVGKRAVIRRGEGQFLFIDGRPVTCKSGIGRLLVKVLREKLAVCPGWEKDAKDAVVIMDVRCAFRLYDVNIEPSKETVLFFDERDVAILLTEWFGRIFAAAEISHNDDQRVVS